MSRVLKPASANLPSMERTSLPAGWSWTTIGEIALNFDGRRVPVKSQVRDNRTGPYPYYGASGVIDDIDDYLFDGEYLLVAEDGANLLSRSTPIAFRAIGQFWVNNHAHVLQLRGDMPLKYLEWLLNGSNLQFYVTGTAQPKLNQVNLNRIKVPLAPLNEQHRIVEKIEQLFSELDAGVAALNRAKANLKRYRASVLKAAVDGSLTAAWRAEHPEAEPASKLLGRILAERRRKWEADQLAKFAAASKEPPKNWRAKYVEPAPPCTADLPDLPKSWCWASIEQLGSVQLGRQRSPKNRSDQHPTKYLRAANITEQGFDLTDVLEMEFKPTDFENYSLAPGDLLLSEASGSPSQVGKPALWKSQLERCCFQNTVIRLRPVITSSDYLMVVFRHFYFNQVFAQLATGVGINHLSANKFSRILVPLAPATEQGVIVEAAELALAALTDGQSSLATAEKRAARLRQSILKQAFEGKLVAQGYADEPASELLARIQKERSATASTSGQKAVKESREVFVRRAAVVTYTVQHLWKHPSFGRTQLEKTLHLAQSHLGVDLGLTFERQVAGPFDKVIYKLEGVARKNDWFVTQKRPTFGVTYRPGTKADSISKYAGGHFGARQADFDQLLKHISQMNTDEAELFATVYAAWNDRLIDGAQVDDDSIIADVHAWHEEKKRFTPEVIRRRIHWMRKHGYVPTGRGEHTMAPTTPARPRRKKQ